MKWLHAIARLEGSTRSAGLLRILVCLLVLSRFSFAVHPLKHPEDWEWLLLGASFYLSVPLMLLGVKTRFTSLWAAGTLLVMVYGFGHNGEMEAWTHHHTKLLAFATALVALLPCGRSYSVDRWLALRAGRAAPEHGDVWALRLIAFQVSMVYVWGAYDKLYLGWFSGDRLQMSLSYTFLGSDFPDAWWLEPFTAVAATSTVLLEFGLGIGLWFKRFRWPLVFAGMVLHGLFYVGLPVSTFSATMVVLYLAFFPPDAVHRALDRLQSSATTSG